MTARPLNELIDEGVDKIGAGMFSLELAKRSGIERSPIAAGRELTGWDQHQKRTNTSRDYELSKIDLSDWVE